MYENMTYEFLLNRMLDRISNAMDKREGSIIFDSNAPAAAELAIVYIELKTILDYVYADTAPRDGLIKRVKERGIIPYPASKAIVKVVTTPETANIPIGARFTGDVFNYTIIEKIQDGEYKAECDTEGADGNEYFGQIVPIEYVQGLATANIVEVLIPGEDEEETESIRKRYFDSFDKRAFGGNVADYIEKVNALPGVSATKVTRVWNSDIHPSDMIPSELVTSWYNGIVDTLSDPVKSWLSTVFNAASNRKLTVGGTVMLTILGADYNKASESLLEFVKEAVDPIGMEGEGLGTAPIGHVVSVRSADEVKINVSFRITFKSGYTWDGMKTEVSDVISEYLTELKKEWQDEDTTIVRLNQIVTRILDLDGIIDIEDTAINGEEENFTLGMYEIPALGEVTNG